MRNISIPIEVAEWLARGERGASSETIVSRIYGLALCQHRSHPHDPADFRRCVLLVESCPEVATRLYVMADESKQWAAIVENWSRLIASMDTECPGWRGPGSRWRAPATYQLMQEMLARSRKPPAHAQPERDSYATPPERGTTQDDAHPTEGK